MSSPNTMYRRLLLLFIIIALALADCGALHAKPQSYPTQNTVADRKNPKPQYGPWGYTVSPATFEQRRAEYLALSAEKDIDGLYGAAARAIIGKPHIPVPESTIAWYEKDIREREDCTDFTTIRVVQALYFNDKYKFLSSEQDERLKQTLLGFKYWITEPGPDTMITWTENHIILFHANEYLAGQRYKNEIFTNNGKTGAWHMEHARGLLLRWLENRARWGFSEWDSNVYYNEDIPAIAALAEFAEDPDVATAASIVLDLLLFDISNDIFFGMYGSSHGRAYDQDLLNNWENSLLSLIKLVWGYGVFTGASNMGAFSIAAAERYRPPEAIILAGQQHAEGYLAFERHGIPITEIRRYGLDPTNLDDLATLWGMGFYSLPETIDLFVKAADTYNLWQHPFIAELGNIGKALPRDGNIGKKTRSLEIESDRAEIGEANKITYRTPDYMLSSAVDYRPGGRGNQHHIWQATLSPDAVVFTTNPGSLKINDDRTPSKWAGQNRLPRVAQYKNLAIILYSINPTKALGEREVFEYTHSFFPKWAFDEIVEENGWIFGRVNNGYIALYSSRPYKWVDTGDEFTHEIIAQGKKNVWICQTGSRSVDGDFSAFRNKILAASLTVNNLEVKFTAPGIGPVEFSWKSPFTVNGQKIPLSGFDLFNSPAGKSTFDSGILDVSINQKKLHTDFAKRLRIIEN